MAILFKGGEQLYNEAVDLVNRKEYSNARSKFKDAIKKGTDKSDLAEVYVRTIELFGNRGDRSKYVALQEALQNVKISSFKFGLTDIDVADLITECELDIKEIDAAAISKDESDRKGQAYIAVAGEFMARIGEKNLKLDEITKGNTVSTGNREALILQAEGYQIMATGAVANDPKLAAEYMQMAYTFRKQIGDSGEEQLRLSKEYARSCTCWICGRPANAEGIHFAPMRSHIEPVFRKMTDNDVVKPISEDCGAIYVCMPCYSAISNRSDDISRDYYNQAIQEMRMMEARLQAEISALRTSMAFRR